MTQNWTDDVFASSHNAQTDLQNMENNFQTLKSLFADSTAPANTVAGIPWFDTGNDLLRIRNAANSAWYGVMHADASQQIWIYRNDAMAGWVIVTSVIDKVLAIKGGTNAYDIVGGQTAGTWTQPGHMLAQAEMPSHDHNVDASIDNAGNHNHRVIDGGETNTDFPPATIVSASESDYLDCYFSDSKATDYSGDHNHNVSVSEDSIGGDGSHNHGSTYRPAAAVGTLQRMDI